MAFWGDYHTHTVHSRRGKKLHACGTVLQNAQAARNAGLKELAITDHGVAHYYGICQKTEAFKTVFDAVRAECAEAERLTGVKIYAGLENNLDFRSGKADLAPFMNAEGVIDELEIIQGGYHAFMGIPTYAKNMMFWTHNVIFPFAGRDKLIQNNTAAYKRVIDEYPIDFIGHLNRGICADAVEVARYAHEKGVYIELNGRHRSLKPDEIKRMVSLGVEFIVNSDAHTPEAVGVMPEAEKLIRRCGIPYELIANWERLPEFRSQAFRSARAKKLRAEESGDVGDKRS